MMATTLQAVSVDMTISPVVNAMDELSILPKIKRCKESNTNIESIENAYTKILDQSKKRLNSLDAQRIVSVVDDTIRKCEMVTLLPHILENLDRYSVMLGSDLLNALKEYDSSQKYYTKALSNARRLRPKSGTSSRPSSKNSVKSGTSENSDPLLFSSSEYTSAMKEVNRLANDVSNSVKTIGRIFKSNPVVVNALKNQLNERSSEANMMIENLVNLRDQVYNRLSTKASEEQGKLKMSVQILKREKKAKSVIKKLEGELNSSNEEMKDMIQNKNEVIRNLKSTIQSIEQEADLSNRKMINDAKKFESADTKNSEVSQTKLQQDIISLKQQLYTNTQNHRDEELQMRKRKFKIETEVENWVQKYDNDMSEKQIELDEIGARYAEEKSQLEQLEDRFETLEIEYKRIIEERRIAREKKEAEEEELERKTKASTLIQSYWRSYKVRKTLKAKQKKGKKGKSSKKRRK